jgi:hypothetical protein
MQLPIMEDLLVSSNRSPWRSRNVEGNSDHIAKHGKRSLTGIIEERRLETESSKICLMRSQYFLPKIIDSP